ncbi:MAG: PQQ-like beta-propeller repeat protein [Planctomycetes bacterium]|nr:PQQ-like beta-propeller repeat protein [Planctomycetota bacterium]
MSNLIRAVTQVCLITSAALNCVLWPEGPGLAAAPPALEQNAPAGEWPQFLGPNRTGISSEINLIESWPVDGPKEVWRAQGGIGMSGLSISRGRLLTIVQKEGEQRLVSLKAQSGEPVWETTLAPEYRNSMGDGPRSTPTIRGDRVFAFTGQGILAALNFDDGAAQWSHNLADELHVKPAEYGMACSPLIVGNLVIVTVGAPRATVVALDAVTGKQIWTAGSDPIGYSSPALLEVSGQPQVVVCSGNSVLGLKPDRGDLLWRYPYATDYNCNIAVPLAVNGQVFVSSGENHGSVLLKIEPAGKAFEVNAVWDSLGVKSVLRNEWQTSILLDGHLYGFDNVGSAGPVTHLTCINAATSQRVWQRPRFGKGNLIAADGKLFVSTMEGELVVVRATPSKYEEIGRTTVVGSTRQAPSLAAGMLYLRDDKDIVCLDVRRK